MKRNVKERERLVRLVRSYHRAYGYPISASEAAELLEASLELIRIRVNTEPNLEWAKSSKGCIIVKENN
jgi:hypothetical protein